MVLVQTKIDLKESQAMSEEDIEALKEETKLQLFETCAKDNRMITEVFQHLGVQHLEIKDQEKLDSKNQPEKIGPVMGIKDIKNAGNPVSLRQKQP